MSANQPYYEEIVAIDGPVPQIDFIIANYKHKVYMKTRTRLSRAAVASADCRHGLARAYVARYLIGAITSQYFQFTIITILKMKSKFT